MMKERIENIFEALKQLDIKATPNNVSILNGVFEVLRGIYQEMGEENERAAVDSEGSDND